YSEVKETLGLSSGEDKLAVIRASGNINRVECQCFHLFQASSLRQSLKRYATKYSEVKETLGLSSGEDKLAEDYDTEDYEDYDEDQDDGM
nr:hypothetical protein [Tanacetum cinerariifolium]